MSRRPGIWASVLLLWSSVFHAPPFFAQTQNPSPMVEHTRAHHRLQPQEIPGYRATLTGVLPRPAELFVTESALAADSLPLLLHFHGASFVAEQAVAASGMPWVLLTVNLGHGSSAYERPFLSGDTFEKLLSAVKNALPGRRPAEDGSAQIYLSAFSAGYGAVRAILRDSAAVAKIQGVLLLDGLHTDYLPEGTVLAAGGALNESKLQPFLHFARLAAAGRKDFLLTHSEIFPGTYASTTETADYLIAAVGLARTPVLRWGPVGMQQLSEARKNHFRVLGFAGNTAPDHVDHYHALPDLLKEWMSDRTGADKTGK